jgi:hypothetical protein
MKKFLSLTLALAGLALASATWAADKMSAQDYAEIQQLYAKYNTAIDGGDAEGWAATFTPDGTFNNSTGHDALVEFVNKWHAGMGARKRHWNSNLVITGDGKEAKGTVYLLLIDVGTKPPSIFAAATYADSLTKTKDGWRFTKRQTKPDAAPTPPAPPATPPAK